MSGAKGPRTGGPTSGADGLRVCVFCSSSEGVATSQRRVAAELGVALARERWSLVYGGGNIGLMGEVARAALAAGATVTGIIPDRLAAREIALLEVTELVRTDTMRERKAFMDERSDAFVVLPGGIGTLEEFVEIVTLRQLGYHDRAVVLLDSEGFWDPLLAQLARMVELRVAQPSLTSLFTVVHTVESAVRALHDHRPRPTSPSAAEELEAVEDPGGAS